MKRILIPLVIAAGLLGAPAHAATTESGIVAELREQGFGQIEIRRTLLGRTRIIAISPAYEREIVLNPATGVILRDFWKVRGPVGDDGPSSLVGAPNLRDGGNRSSSGSTDDNDDDNDSSSGSSSGSSDSSSDDDDDGDSGGDDSSGDSGSDDSDDDSDDDD
jgi:hypothetical protein